MKLLYVEIEGFGSIIQKLKYKYDRPGVNIISGVNGVGKTTIFNATSWNIYGELLKKNCSVDPWQDIKPKDFKGTIVKTVWEGGLEIIRCANYKGKIHGKRGKNRLIILQNDVELYSERNKNDQQKWIVEQLGYSFQLFKNSVLFGQEVKRLLQDDGPSKKKTFDEAFESTFINKAKEITQDKLETTIKELTIEQTKYDSMETLLKSLKDGVSSKIKLEAEFELRKDENIRAFRNDIKAIRNTILSQLEKAVALGGNDRDALIELIQIQHGIIDKYRPKIKDVSTEEFQTMLDITNMEKEIEDLERQMKKDKGSYKRGSFCSNCGRKLTGEKLQENKDKLKKSLRKCRKKIKQWKLSLKPLKAKHTKLTTQIKRQSKYQTKSNDAGKEVKKLEDELSLITNIKVNVNRNKDDIKRIKAQIRKEKSATMDFKVKEAQDKVNATLLEFAGLETILKKLKKRKEIYTWLIHDPLSNSGLKAFIFDSMLGKVNYYLKYYTHFIGFKVNVSMNLESANKDFEISILKNSFEVPYEDLSRGQKQLVEVVLCFALNDVVNVAKPINILLMDEIFESLSADNVEIVGNIIVQKSHNKSIHLITHHKSFTPTPCYRTNLSFENGQTLLHSKLRES